MPVSAAARAFRKLYPEASTALKHSEPFQLLIATILSAQCTDERVNRITPGLFRKYSNPAGFASAGIAELERDIHSAGFYRMKARAIKDASKTIIEKFGGKVPETMEELLQLRGVARKTANVVLGSGYGIAAGVVVDTHVKRLSFRMELSREKDPVKIERDLMEVIPKKDWIWFAHAMIRHGREICRASKPDCPACGLNSYCPKRGV
ncbi:MAG: endonuclease III [bacterium]